LRASSIAALVASGGSKLKNLTPSKPVFAAQRTQNCVGHQARRDDRVGRAARPIRQGLRDVAEVKRHAPNRRHAVREP
jgi:hypothetical protein